METLRGIVERITYFDENNGFSVLKIRCKGYSELVTISGNMSSVSVGSVLTLEGNWVINPKFGRQFNVVKWEESLPASIYGIEKYLGSGLIRGVGPKYAKLIVKTFGEETINVIENEPHRLTEVPNIGQKRISQIISAWKEHKDIKNLMIFLQDQDVSTALGHKIYKTYGSGSIDKVRENPYRLADEVNGIGFKTSDQIAMKLGMDKESYNRCRAGIFHILNQFANNEGHCYLPVDELVKNASEILDIEDAKIVMTFNHLINIKELIKEDDDKIYLPPFFFSELGVARRINKIISCKTNEIKSIDSKIKKLQKNSDIKYDEAQISAIKLALESKFSVITGGPGTGKTTITKAIIDIFKSENKKVLLTAPTGRAAKRMTEMCEITSKTIHRLLESSPKEGFGKNENNQLKGDVLIVDEASMIDLILMYNLLKAVPDEMAVILVGDKDQLPSVGAGNVLKDIIDSGVVPVIKLSQIYRQAQNSRIITNAHKINSGEIIDLSNDINSDFFFIESKDPKQTATLISDLCSKRLPKKYKLNPILDIHVLTPMKKGETGTDNLNTLLQSALNKNDRMLKRATVEYRLDDKVMQIKNNYDKDVYNGDIGYISDINLFDKKLTVNFEDRNIDYDILELEELILAYAMTIHKSQGGEFPVVILPVSFHHKIMLERNLLYTAVTRAKKLIILIGEKQAVKFAIENNNSRKRYSLLSERIKKESI